MSNVWSLEFKPPHGMGISDALRLQIKKFALDKMPHKCLPQSVPDLAVTNDMGLSDTLRLRMRKSAFEKTPYKFLPQSALDLTITKAAILTAMCITKPTRVDYELVTFILEKAKRLFATAAYIGLQADTLYAAMAVFQNANFSDERLPLEELGEEECLTDGMIRREHPLFTLEGPFKHEHERIWTFGRVHAFLEAQFSFLAPVVHIGEPDHDLRNHILPFLKKHATQSEGAFGVVSKYEFHSDHLRDPAGQAIASSNIVAVKEFKRSHGSDHKEVAHRWASEVKALATMNTLNHDHIVRFITAFSRGTPEAPEYYLVTEWADGGNLHDLWKSIPNPPHTESSVRALIEQLRGLADALCAVHSLRSNRVHTDVHYRHGDLKPANILWFGSGNKMGVLKIGDWGEAKSHQAVTIMRNSNTTARYGTRRYQPPECEVGIGTTHLGGRDMRRSRLYDIWSFGCITLECIIWLMYGTKELRKFNESVSTGSGDGSPFYQVDQAHGIRSARVHDTVRSWMKHMSKDEFCRPATSALGDLLEVVRTSLLVVSLPRNGGSVPSSNALSPNEVRTDSDPVLVFLNRSLHPTQSPSRTTFQEIPSINVTLPDEAKTDEADSLDLQPRSAIGKPVRYRADQLRDKLDLIESRLEMNSYPSKQQELPPPRTILDRCSMHTSFDANEQRRQPIGDYSAHTVANFSVHRMSSVRDYGEPEASLERRAKDTKSDDDEAHFTTRGRPKGSRNKRTVQTTQDSAKTSNSTSSSQPSTSKRPRLDRDDDDQGDQDDERQSPQRRDRKTSLQSHNLACPYAKYRPLEYPRCRASKFRDVAKIKEHLREDHSVGCGRCGEAFYTESLEFEHARQDPPCTLKPLDKAFGYMHPENRKNIDSYGIKWPGLYGTLFPGHLVPDDSCYEDSERLVFELIYKAHGSEVSPPRLFDLYQQNQRAESTCSARAVLERDRILASTQSGAFQTSDSGYSAPEEHPPAEGPSAPSTKHSEAVPQEQDETGTPAVDISTTEQMPNAGTAGECEARDVIESAITVETKEMHTASGSVDLSTEDSLGLDHSTDNTMAAPIQQQPDDFTDDLFGTFDPSPLPSYEPDDWFRKFMMEAGGAERMS